MVGIKPFGAYIALGRMERDVFYRFRGGSPHPGEGYELIWEISD